jgi:hypothetical protein
MEILEQQRLSLLPPAQRESGVIVPIVLRGRKHLPDHIGKKRQYWDFSDFTLAEGDLRKSPAYAKALVEIAAYVEERVREIEAANADPCACCHGFSLPSASDVAALIASAARPPAFPLRETSP